MSKQKRIILTLTVVAASFAPAASALAGWNPPALV
jgi:hypothetical protein